MKQYLLIENDNVIGNADGPEGFGRWAGEAVGYEGEYVETGSVSNGDGTFCPPTAPPPTIDDVIAERTRRFAVGFDYDFGDDRGVHHIGTTPEDLAGWDEVTQLAAALIALGNESATIAVITDTGPAEVTAMEWQSVLVAAGAFRQPLWAASFALQAMTPEIPYDFDTNESYWTG